MSIDPAGLIDYEWASHQYHASGRDLVVEYSIFEFYGSVVPWNLGVSRQEEELIDAVFDWVESITRLEFVETESSYADINISCIDYFTDEYMLGRTPNPCVLCNTHIKWEALLKRADKLDCEFIATGHYANINKLDSRFYVSKVRV